MLFRSALQDELESIFRALPAARAIAEYKDLVRGLGIVTDKIFLLDKKPTAIVQHIDMTAVEAEIIRRIESGELDRAGVMSIVEDESLADKLFRGAQTRVQAGKAHTDD